MGQRGYLDIHSHILPGVDDGSKDWEMTMQMLKLAYRQGVRHIVATPHNYPGTRTQDNGEIRKLVKEANEKKCSLLCSNGYQYDSIQICNFVIIFPSKQEFILEWSTKDVALREMYEYPTTVLKGNIKDDLKDMEWTNRQKNKIGTKEIEKILLWAFSLNMINKSIEATLYSKKVGILDQEIVCWQID